jgi:hypothetical protein
MRSEIRSLPLPRGGLGWGENLEQIFNEVKKTWPQKLQSPVPPAAWVKH